ncbi:MAG: hypothetical protein AABP62_21115 [Planctomycetota bacterium]
MSGWEELMQVSWPGEFVIEYVDGSTELLLSGDGVSFTPAADAPDGIGAIHADLPKKHPANQKQIGRYVRYSELQAIHTPDGRVIWSRT